MPNANADITHLAEHIAEEALLNHSRVESLLAADNQRSSLKPGSLGGFQGIKALDPQDRSKQVSKR